MAEPADSGTPVEGAPDALEGGAYEAIRQRLLEQLTAPVRWAQSLERMQAEGATRFVEVGTGKVLSGLVKRTLGRGADTAQAGTAADLDALAA